jgi:muconolactone delta-isomerase
MDKLKLTPAEMNIVKYHRDTIKSGKVGSDSEGRPITVYSTGILVPEGPMKGKFVSVPGYVKGTTKWTEGQLYEIWKEDIQSGKWPTYQSSQELNKRSQEIHSIMDNEAPEAVQSREKAMPPRMQSRQLLKDLETPQWLK